MPYIIEAICTNRVRLLGFLPWKRLCGTPLPLNAGKCPACHAPRRLLQLSRSNKSLCLLLLALSAVSAWGQDYWRKDLRPVSSVEPGALWQTEPDTLKRFDVGTFKITVSQKQAWDSFDQKTLDDATDDILAAEQQVDEAWKALARAQDRIRRSQQESQSGEDMTFTWHTDLPADGGTPVVSSGVNDFCVPGTIKILSPRGKYPVHAQCRLIFTW